MLMLIGGLFITICMCHRFYDAFVWIAELVHVKKLEICWNYEGRPINKLQNGIILLIFKI